MRWQCAGAMIVAMAATSAHAADPPSINTLAQAVFDNARAAPVEWRSAEFAAARDTRLEISLGGRMRDARGLPPASPAAAASFEPQGFDVRVRRDWPGAVRLRTGARDIEVTPHAGVSFSNAGPGAQAGATVSLSDRVADRLDELGLRDGRSFGDAGRWYLFAAASGRSVGLNMLRDEGGLRRAGWSTDATSALVSDAQAGVGWRRGAAQASVVYIHREIEPASPIMGMEMESDDLIALSFSFKAR